MAVNDAASPLDVPHRNHIIIVIFDTRATYSLTKILSQTARSRADFDLFKIHTEHSWKGISLATRLIARRLLSDADGGGVALATPSRYRTERHYNDTNMITKYIDWIKC